VLIKIFDIYSCFSQTQQLQNVIFLMNFQKLLDQNSQTGFFRVGTCFVCVDKYL
jgi:hypothetical protein